MEVTNTKILKFHPGTLEAVRKEFNMDKETVHVSIALLEDWLKKQAHFVKKSYSPDYLERTLGTCKGSVERAKERIDNLCTFRTLMPEYFELGDVKNEVAVLKQFVSVGGLPKLTPNHMRIFMIRTENESFKSSHVFPLGKYLILMGEYMRRFECCSGFRLIIDYRNINILSIVTKWNPIEGRKLITLLKFGYGMRVKKINIISNSKLIDSVITILKQTINPNISNKITVHNDLEDLYKAVPKELLPEEYGGKEKPLRAIFDDWFEELTSDEHIEYAIEMNKAKTVENCRLNIDFNEYYMGTPGSFRAMKLD